MTDASSMLPGPADMPLPRAEAQPAAARPGDPTAPGSGGRHRYASSTLRATVFSFVFLLLLPFFASLPAMMAMRLSSGHWDSTIGLAILAAGFTVLMLLVLAEVLFSIRARIVLGDTAVKLTLPAGRGLIPMLSYRRHEIPYADIKAIETRREIYGGALAPVMMRGARIVTRSGDTIQLGYLNEANVDPAFPYAEIAEKIAARAGLVIDDRGAVRRKVTNKMLGFKSDADSADAINEQTIADLNLRHRQVVIAMIAGLVLLVGIGIAVDLSAPADPVTSQPAQTTPASKKK